MRKISRIVVHCSDSSDNQDIGAAEITAWHLKRGFNTIGYHAVIRRNGKVELGRPDNEIGAHVMGHNHDSLGICVVGKTAFAPDQVFALINWLKKKLAQYGLKPGDVYGHKEFDSNKTCPNLDIEALRRCL